MCLYLLSGSLESALPGLVHTIGLTGGFDLSVQILRNELEIRHYESRIPILCLRGYTGDLPTRECRTMTDCADFGCCFAKGARCAHAQRQRGCVAG